MSKLLSSIDIGSNSSLLLIAKEVKLEDGSYDIIPVIDRQVTCRLGEKLHESNVIAVERINQLKKILIDYRQTISNVGAELQAVVLTEAVRLANNKQEVLDVVEKAMRHKPLILSGEEEALLGWKAIAGKYSNIETSEIVTLDVGGGSSELADGKRMVSMPVGALKMMQKHGIIPEPELELELEDLIVDNDLFVDFKIDVFKNKDVYLIGGTATVLAMLIQNLKKFELDKIENFKLNLKEIDQLIIRLSDMDSEYRNQLPGLEGGRGEIIIAGLRIVRFILSKLDAKSVSVSSLGLRFGVLYKDEIK